MGTVAPVDDARTLDQTMAEARALVDAGRHESALDVLTRVSAADVSRDPGRRVEVRQLAEHVADRALTRNVRQRADALALAADRQAAAEPQAERARARGGGSWVPCVLRLGLLCCFLLPLVTVGASCSEFRTKPITGAELLVGKTPEIVSSGSPYPNAVLSSDESSEINDKYDMARTGALGVFLFTTAALGAALLPSRGASVAGIVLGPLSLVALAMMVGATVEGGATEPGLGLAYLFTLLAIIGDVYVFRRRGGRFRVEVGLLLVLAVPATQVIGVLIGARSGGG